MSDLPKWSGPRDAEPGTRYARNDADSDSDVFEVTEVVEHDDGTVTVTGRWE